MIQSIIANIFKNLVLDGLSSSLKNEILSEQHGFCSGSSTITNLCAFNNYVHSAVLRYHQVDCIYLDFAMAFDRVSYSHLISKLKALAVMDPLLQWLRS